MNTCFNWSFMIRVGLNRAGFQDNEISLFSLGGRDVTDAFQETSMVSNLWPRVRRPRSDTARCHVLRN
jgi:hypothetical protein